MLKILLYLFLVTLLSCNGSGKGSSTSSGTSQGGSTETLTLSYDNPTSSSGYIDSPSFKLTRSGGSSGFSAGTSFQVYSGANCDVLIGTTSISMYSYNVALYVSLTAPGTYTFSAKFTHSFAGLSETSACSNAINYQLLAPLPPTSMSLFSGSSPSSNPNPQVTISGGTSGTYNIYTNSTCSGTAFYSTTSNVFILPPLIFGTFDLYVKTKTSNAIWSSCSAKLLSYSSTNASTLNLTIGTTKFAEETKFLMSDVDGDGKEDIVYGDNSGYGRVKFGDGSGGFSSTVNLNHSSQASALLVDDIDHDGDKDILIGLYEYRQIYLFTNNGNRTFTRTLAIDLGYNAFDAIDKLDFVDIDKDGNKDLVIGAARNSKVYIAKGNANGSLQNYIELISGAAISNYYLADIDKDSDLDLVQKSGYDLKFYTNNGSGTLSLTRTQTTTLYGDFHVADFNGDNYPDIVTIFSTSINVLLNDTTGAFPNVTSQTFSNSVSSAKQFKSVDIDGDTNRDIVISNSTNKLVYVFKGQGDGTFQYPLIYPVASSSTLQFFDWDGNGKLDILTDYIISQ